MSWPRRQGQETDFLGRRADRPHAGRGRLIMEALAERDKII